MPLKVLHIAGHLGGGVGRCLSALATHNKNGTAIQDSFICLETPRDARYADAIRACGAELRIAPAIEEIKQAIAASDIVQIEWWHHPLLAGILAQLNDVPARWTVWSHTSGLHYPVIPPGFAALPQAFITTAPASLAKLGTGANIRVCVSSTGGFDDFPLPASPSNAVAHVGYLGSLNPAKLHPDIMRFMSDVARPGFSADFYGDSAVNPALKQEVRRRGESSPIKLRGFSSHPQAILPGIDIFPYILNPAHYGTTENALLEAMACGAIPIVLDNPIESGIVQNDVTGFVVSDAATFATAMHRLLDDDALRSKMSAAAATTTRKKYSVAASAEKLADIYREIMPQPKTPRDFRGVFGPAPADWFLSCLGDYADCFAEEQRARRRRLPFLYEKSKSSVFHFHACFPEDARLAAWETLLSSDLAASEEIAR